MIQSHFLLLHKLFLFRLKKQETWRTSLVKHRQWFSVSFTAVGVPWRSELLEVMVGFRKVGVRKGEGLFSFVGPRLFWCVISAWILLEFGSGDHMKVNHVGINWKVFLSFVALPWLWVKIMWFLRGFEELFKWFLTFYGFQGFLFDVFTFEMCLFMLFFVETMRG